MRRKDGDDQSPIDQIDPVLMAKIQPAVTSIIVIDIHDSELEFYDSSNDNGTIVYGQLMGNDCTTFLVRYALVGIGSLPAQLIRHIDSGF